MSNKLLNEIQGTFDGLTYLVLTSSIVALSFTSCSIFNRSKSSDKGQTDIKALKSEPTFHHGFGGDPNTFKLIDRMDTRELANLVNDEEAAKKIKTGPKPSLIYTGKSLALKECAASPTGAEHISELWNQEYLLGLFTRKDLGFKTALESLQEKDDRGLFRPKDPIHPNLIKRMKDGVNEEHWVLNAIRFRIADPSSNSEFIFSGDPTQAFPVPVKGQIKLNYELDRYGAQTEASIASASFIHSIAIHDNYIGEFIKDVFQVSQQPDKSGCDILNILNKYIRNKGLPKNLAPRSSYFFLHTNIFDTSAGIDEWRFTEHKLVTNDSETYTTDNLKIKRAKILRTLVPQDKKDGLFEGEITSDNLADVLHDLEERVPAEFRNIHPSRSVRGAMDSPAGQVRDNIALRVVPMQFPRSIASEDADLLMPALDKAPLVIWFSGTLTDFGQNASTQDLDYDLVKFADGSTVGENHPIRRHEETKTCAQCHSARHDTKLDPKTLSIKEIPSMNFRHIGFGDGGNRRCNPFFGLVRPDFHASLSTYLLKTANGFEINGYSANAVRPAPQPMADFAQFNAGVFASETGIDVVRCFNIDGSKTGAVP